MRSIRWTLPLLLGMGVAWGLEPAGAIYDNINTTVRGYGSVAENNGLYNSFRTGVAENLTDVKVRLDLKFPASGSFTVALYADNATKPGTLLLTLGTRDDTTVTAPGIYDFPVSPGFPLTANTRYWIGITNASGFTAAGWAYNFFADSQNALDTANEYYCDGNGEGNSIECYLSGGDPLMMFVGGSPPASVPALSPPALVTLGLLLLAIPLWLIRRKYRFQQ